MGGEIGIVQIGFPGPAVPQDAEGYWEAGQGGRFTSMYGELLGMQHIFIGYHKLIHQDGGTPEIGFEYAPEDPAPQWPDPARPQQVHLDMEVADLEFAEKIVLSHGATPRRHTRDHRTFADPIGHPFCLYATQARTGTAPGWIARVVFDCSEPRELASFYQEFLDMPSRPLDTAGRVEISGGRSGVALAFQHSDSEPPRWPDPAHPAQMHLDIAFPDDSGRDLAERLGATRLPTPDRPEHLVYADPAGHPFCLGLGGWGTYGPAQVEEYEHWIAAQEGGTAD